MKPSLAARVPVEFLSLDQFPILDQLQLEEALLRVDDRNWCILNKGSPKSIVMGISGMKEKLVNSNCLLKNPVPVIRRFTGGGTVFIDTNTVFMTWIFNANSIGVACCPKKVHQRMANFYRQALPELQMNLRENDYVIGERKWGGNAQYLCKGRWLHHTSMLWDYDLQNMDYLLMPERIPEYRKLRSHEEFLCRLKDHFPRCQEFQQRLVEKLIEEFEVNPVSLKEAKEIMERPHRKATSVI